MSARLCSLHVYVKYLEQMASIGWNNTDKSSQFTGKESRTGPLKKWPTSWLTRGVLHYSINT